MRTAWLSPTAGNSGIVEYTRQILPELARYLDVELWSDGVPDRPPEGVVVVDYRREPQRVEELRDYELVIFNLGNHLGFHRRELEISRRVPGLVILHDRTLHHLWAGYYVSHLNRPERYAQRMRALYGSRGVEVAAAVIAQRGEAAWSHPEEVLEHSFLLDTLQGALGVVVHSRGHAEQIRGTWPGQVCDLRFPSYPDQLSRPPRPLLDDGDRRLQLVSVGHVDSHKQIHATIAALGGDRALAATARYAVVGAYDPRGAYVRDLHRAIADGGLADTVALLGYQPAHTLERYLDGADVFVNLRQPNLESGSASLMEQMARGRPVVAYDTGSFAELPEGTVLRVDPGGPEMLITGLRRITEDAELRHSIGARARAYAESVSASGYAKELARFAGEAERWRARRTVAAHAGRALGWLGVDDVAVAENVAGDIDRLLSAHPRRNE